MSNYSTLESFFKINLQFHGIYIVVNLNIKTNDNNNYNRGKITHTDFLTIKQ